MFQFKLIYQDKVNIRKTFIIIILLNNPKKYEAINYYDYHFVSVVYTSIIFTSIKNQSGKRPKNNVAGVLGT